MMMGISFRCKQCEKHKTDDIFPWESPIEEGVFWGICSECFRGKMESLCTSSKTPFEAQQKIKSHMFFVKDRMDTLGLKELKVHEGVILIFDEEPNGSDKEV